MVGKMKKIPSHDLVAFAPLSSHFPVEVDLVYAKSGHPENAFGQIYHEEAMMWGHIDLVKVVMLAASCLQKAHGWTLIVKDCLRPVEAQELMIATPIVKAHPHWLIEPRFLSGPGQGGHPRGMAVDLGAKGKEGAEIDFGTGFDHFSDVTDKNGNPAHREYPHLPETAKSNREKLESAMVLAAKDLNLPMLPLPQEWWDFRFPSAYTKEFAPLSAADLLPHQQMTNAPEKAELLADIRVIERLRDLV